MNHTNRNKNKAKYILHYGAKLFFCHKNVWSDRKKKRAVNKTTMKTGFKKQEKISFKFFGVFKYIRKTPKDNTMVLLSAIAFISPTELAANKIKGRINTMPIFAYKRFRSNPKAIKIEKYNDHK